jgi:hypothetical protein
MLSPWTAFPEPGIDRGIIVTVKSDIINPQLDLRPPVAARSDKIKKAFGGERE